MSSKWAFWRDWGAWALGGWPEMGRDLGMQSMARIGAIWIDFDFTF